MPKQRLPGTQTRPTATLGAFTQPSDLTVADLRDLPQVPSLFDPENRGLRAPLAFIRGFIRDMTAIADPTDEHNLEYIPTQVIAEPPALRPPSGRRHLALNQGPRRHRVRPVHLEQRGDRGRLDTADDQACPRPFDGP